MLFFRIQRELDMKKQGERIWLPVADWLLVAATVVSLLANAFPRIGLVLGRRNAFECVFVRIIIGPHAVSCFVEVPWCLFPFPPPICA